MGSESTQSGAPSDADATALQQGFAHIKHAVLTGLQLGRKHVPVVARKTADGLKRAGEAIRESERTKKITTSGRKAGRAAGRVVKEKASKWPWLVKSAGQVSDATVRATCATRKHLVEERYFEKSLKTLQEQRKRYPAIDNLWTQLCHAFSMAPESSSAAPAGKARRKKKATHKKTAARSGKATHTTKKTAAKKTTTKKKTARKTTARKRNQAA